MLHFFSFLLSFSFLPTRENQTLARLLLLMYIMSTLFHNDDVDRFATLTFVFCFCFIIILLKKENTICMVKGEIQVPHFAISS